MLPATIVVHGGASLHLASTRGNLIETALLPDSQGTAGKVKKRMHEHARSTDALFRTLIATAVDGIIVIDERGLIGIYNAACERLFGYHQDEVIGKNVKMLMPSPYREEHDGYIDN